MIKDILRPDFPQKGKRFKFGVEDLIGEKAAAIGEKETTMPVSQAPTTATQLPAWIFCTRYSDRPSSGEGKYVRTMGTSMAILHTLIWIHRPIFLFANLNYLFV